MAGVTDASLTTIVFFSFLSLFFGPTALNKMASSIGNNSSGSWNMDGRRNDSNDEQDRTTPCICNICLDTAKDAVVSLCGHLYWSVSFISLVGYNLYYTSLSSSCPSKRLDRIRPLVKVPIKRLYQKIHRPNVTYKCLTRSNAIFVFPSTYTL